MHACLKSSHFEITVLFGELSVDHIKHYNALIRLFMNQLTLQKLICSILSLKNTIFNVKHLSYLIQIHV